MAPRRPGDKPFSESMMIILLTPPDSKVHGANMGPIWGRHDPGGPHVGPMNFAIWAYMRHSASMS